MRGAFAASLYFWFPSNPMTTELTVLTKSQIRGEFSRCILDGISGNPICIRTFWWRYLVIVFFCHFLATCGPNLCILHIVPL